MNHKRSVCWLSHAFHEAKSLFPRKACLSIIDYSYRHKCVIRLALKDGGHTITPREKAAVPRRKSLSHLLDFLQPDRKITIYDLAELAAIAKESCRWTNICSQKMISVLQRPRLIISQAYRAVTECYNSCPLSGRKLCYGGLYCRLSPNRKDKTHKSSAIFIKQH